jgi:hypothetical protein
MNISSLNVGRGSGLAKPVCRGAGPAGPCWRRIRSRSGLSHRRPFFNSGHCGTGIAGGRSHLNRRTFAPPPRNPQEEEIGGMPELGEKVEPR